MTRLSKISAKVVFSFCTLFCLYSPFVFSQQVDTAWVRRYNGPGNGDDKAVAIAVDSSGNIYVTGSSFDSTTGYDYCTIKYLPIGDTAWVRRYNGPPNDTDLARALVLDDNSNVYVTGVSEGFITTVKYDSSGNQLWDKRLESNVNFNRVSINGGYALGLDGRGNLYVTGQQWDLESWVWFLVKYDTAGNLQWFRSVAVALNTDFDLAVDTSGYVYVVAGDQTVKYDPQGNWLWTRNFSGEARALALDINGNVCIAGGAGNYFVTTKYDSNGNLLWTQNYGEITPGPGGFKGASAIAVDKNNNVFVTGQIWDIEYWIWYTIKYDSTGNDLWTIGGWFGFYEPSSALRVDTGGNVYVLAGENSYSAVKYDPQGNLIWNKYYPIRVKDISVDLKGNIYVTGYSAGAGTGNDFATIKYSPLPQLKGDLNFDGVLSTADVVLSINCTFLGEAPPAAPAACDINCDGKVTPADVVVLLNMVFLSVSAPC